ncbi:MAG TPA: hypothetical protein VFN79_18000 [Steroidobacteraceae bacterium]|nr:hypothetical protein [Steroidobacteraceae bacterium]
MSDSDIRADDTLAHLRRLTVPLEQDESWEPAYLCAVAREGVAEIERLRAEVERLNKWADSFSDSQLEERRTGEQYQRELRAEIERMRSAPHCPTCGCGR